MTGKSRPMGGGSRTLARSNRSVARTPDEVLRDAQAEGKHEFAALLAWLMGRAA